MKKLVANSLLSSSRLLLFVLVFIGLAAGSCDPFLNDGFDEDVRDKISYSINLDNKYKVKEEGNKLFYRVPLNTNVEISSTKGKQGVYAVWKVTYKKYWGNNIDYPEDSSIWKFSSPRPALIEVQGEPVQSSTSMRTEDKIFVIEWFVDDEELNPDSKSLKVEFVFLDEKGHKISFLPKDTINLDGIDDATEALNGSVTFKIAITNIGDKPIDLGKLKYYYLVGNDTYEVSPNLFSKETYLFKEDEIKTGKIKTPVLDFPITVKTADKQRFFNNVRFIIKDLSGGEELLGVDAGKLTF
jgi:hypothetical protein